MDDDQINNGPVDGGEGDFDELAGEFDELAAADLEEQRLGRQAARLLETERDAASAKDLAELAAGLGMVDDVAGKRRSAADEEIKAVLSRRKQERQSAYRLGRRGDSGLPKTSSPMSARDLRWLAEQGIAIYARLRAGEAAPAADIADGQGQDADAPKPKKKAAKKSKKKATKKAAVKAAADVFMPAADEKLTPKQIADLAKRGGFEFLYRPADRGAVRVLVRMCCLPVRGAGREGYPAQQLATMSKSYRDYNDHWMLGVVKDLATASGGRVELTECGDFIIEFARPQGLDLGDGLVLHDRVGLFEFPAEWIKLLPGDELVEARAQMKTRAALAAVPASIIDALRMPLASAVDKSIFEEARQADKDSEEGDPEPSAAQLKLLPKDWRQVRAKHARYGQDAFGREVKLAYPIHKVFLDLFPDVRVYCEPGREPADKEFRKNAAFPAFTDRRWAKPPMMDCAFAAIDICGNYSAESRLSKAYALLTTMAIDRCVGTLEDLDAPIPRGCKDGRKEMLMEETGVPLQLSPGEGFAKPCEFDERVPVFRRMATRYDPDADCPKWEEVVRNAWNNGKRTPEQLDEQCAFYRRLCGYKLLGGNPEQVFEADVGEGQNSKSLCNDTLLGLLGIELAVQTQSDPYFEGKYSGDPKVGELQDIVGKRLVLIPEMPPGKKWKTDRMKACTGDRKFSYRPFHGPPRQTAVTQFFTAQGNNYPPGEGGKGWLRRIILLRWEVQIADGDVDPLLLEKLEEERPGILNWLLAGLADYYALGGLCPPDDVKKDSEDYAKRGGHRTDQFLSQHVAKTPGRMVKLDEVYVVMKSYISANEDIAFKDVKVGKGFLENALINRGFRVITYQKVKRVLDCSFTDAEIPEPFEGDDDSKKISALQGATLDALRAERSEAMPKSLGGAAAEAVPFGGQPAGGPAPDPDEEEIPW